MQSSMESLIRGINQGEVRMSGLEDKVEELEKSKMDKSKWRCNINSHIIFYEKIKCRGY